MRIYTGFRVAVATILLFSAPIPASAQGTIKRDLFPGASNSHIYIVVLTTDTRGSITLQWDNPDTDLLVSFFENGSTLSTDVRVFAIGVDQIARVETGLPPGEYEVWITGFLAPTHYHMNSELATQVPAPTQFGAARQVTDLRRERLIEGLAAAIGAGG